jgi:RNA polymerase sigma-70 factor (ECF subfamily)
MLIFVHKILVPDFWSDIDKCRALSVPILASQSATGLRHRRIPTNNRKFAKDFALGAVFTYKDRMRIENEDVPEAQLVRDAQSGDARSFEVLFDHYYDMIHAFAYRVCLVETEADDIAQETFIRAARGISSYRGAASFKNWLYRIAHNALVDWRRQSARQRDKQDQFAIELEFRAQARIADYAGVHSALKQLSPDLREAVTLVYFEEMNHREAANVAGCAETTISWRIFRAKRLLKNLLGSKKGEAL